MNGTLPGAGCDAKLRISLTASHRQQGIKSGRSCNARGSAEGMHRIGLQDCVSHPYLALAVPGCNPVRNPTSNSSTAE